MTCSAGILIFVPWFWGPFPCEIWLALLALLNEQGSRFKTWEPPAPQNTSPRSGARGRFLLEAGDAGSQPQQAAPAERRCRPMVEYVCFGCPVCYP